MRCNTLRGWKTWTRFGVCDCTFIEECPSNHRLRSTKLVHLIDTRSACDLRAEKYKKKRRDIKHLAEDARSKIAVNLQNQDSFKLADTR